jgi:rhamnosyltransferase
MGNNQTKMAIGFVIYRPEKSFYERLELINQVGVQFYVYDNSPEIIDAKIKIESLLHARYLCSGKNEGLGVGLSELCQTAYKDEFDELLFFDQDTGFNLKTISFIQSFLNDNITSLIENYSAITFSGSQASNLKNNSPMVNVDFTINSGSLFLLRNLKKMGWHNKTYFVDGVDYEFCLRSHAAGFRIAKYSNTPCFDHESEQPDRVVTFFGKRLLIRKYSYIRVRDAVYSYVRLIIQALAYGEWIYSIKIMRSFLIYIAGQILSRISWRNK